MHRDQERARTHAEQWQTRSSGHGACGKEATWNAFGVPGISSGRKFSTGMLKMESTTRSYASALHRAIQHDSQAMPSSRHSNAPYHMMK